MNDLRKEDNKFLNSEFITNVNNIFVQLNLSIMKNDLTTIDHFVDNNVFDELKKKLDTLNSLNQAQVFDEINIKQTTVLKIEELEEHFIAKVNITSEYISYIIDKNTRTVISGNPNLTIEKENYLTFQKEKGTNNQSEARKCHSCGSNMNINNSGKCQYCGAIYNLEDYDWILTDLKTL